MRQLRYSIASFCAFADLNRTDFRTYGMRPRLGPVRVTLAIGTLIAAVMITACSSSGGSPSKDASDTDRAKHTGQVKVLYAGSLMHLMEEQIGPGFKAATGYTLDGFSAGSSALATQIQGKVRQGDVFVSASPKVTQSLEGAAGGGWVSWYGTFATSGLVLGYNPDSTFAHDLKTKPWYQVISERGFRIGLTDPATDPKGKLAAQALTGTATRKNLPALKAIASNTSNVFPEETLVGRLQSGQLDAGFFYTAEATAAKIATVPLAGVDLKASYTVSILKGAPDAAAAEAFVAYLLGPSGQAALRQDGFALVTPATVSGTGVPAALRSLLAG